MKTATNALREIAAPGIINDNHGANGRPLNDSLCLAAISHTLPRALDQQYVDGCLVVVVAPLDKCVRLQDGAKSIFRMTPPEQLNAHRLGHQHSRKKEAELGQ